MVTTASEGIIYLWSYTGEFLSYWKCHKDDAVITAMSMESNYIATGDDTGRVNVINIEEIEPVHTFEINKVITAVTLSKDT